VLRQTDFVNRPAGKIPRLATGMCIRTGREFFPMPEAQLMTAPRTKPAGVYLVEDNDDLRQLLELYLATEPGFRVVGQSTSAEDAISEIGSLKPDAVLIDVSLPGMDGIELARQLHGSFPGLPCIMLSAHRADGYEERSVQAGARAYVAKDAIDSLPGILRRVLDGESDFVDTGL
jgi:DNA-binding NarL/FixJ family response regulator